MKKMGTQFATHWRTAHIGAPHDRMKIGGVPIWQRDWRWIDRRTVRLPHPLKTSETFSFMVCEVGSRNEPIRFAAAQIEPDIWAFYTPD
ncbi:hypothetical protein ACX40Y_10030 [Sphingomonas sp. RS6]